MDETRNLRYCYEILRGRILAGDEHYGLWRMKLKIATYFLKRYDVEFDPDRRGYAKELSDSEERDLLRGHPLLQERRVYGEGFSGPSREFRAQQRKKIEKYLEHQAKHATASRRPGDRR
jgi:hypothetical protein